MGGGDGERRDDIGERPEATAMQPQIGAATPRLSRPRQTIRHRVEQRETSTEFKFEFARPRRICQHARCDGGTGLNHVAAFIECKIRLAPT